MPYFYAWMVTDDHGDIKIREESLRNVLLAIGEKRIISALGEERILSALDDEKIIAALLKNAPLLKSLLAQLDAEQFREEKGDSSAPFTAAH
jgi:hypothetical protein